MPGGGCGRTKLHRTSVPPARDDGTSLGQEPDQVISFQGINYLRDNTNINTSVWGWGARFVFFQAFFPQKEIKEGGFAAASAALAAS